MHRQCSHPDCPTILNSYNKADTCWLHTAPTLEIPRLPERKPYLKKRKTPLPETKVCAFCKENKPISEFYIMKTGNPYSYCKPCDNAKRKKWEDKNRDKLKEYNHRWYLRKKARAGK